MGFTKLHSTILNSSIWNEDDDTRLVWITMLAMSDGDGEVKASMGGIAHQARKSIESTQKSIKILESPDLDSSRKDHDGRRIVKIEGGWLLLNHAYYRELGMTDSQRAYWREQKRLQRNVLKCPRTKRQTGSPASASVSVSVSDSGENGVEKDVSETLRWYDLVYSAFPVTPPSYPDQIVLANCSQLIRLGRKLEELENLCGWVRSGQCGKFGPNSPKGLTQPDQWDKWCTMRHKSKTGGETPPEIDAQTKAKVAATAGLYE